MTVSMDTLVAFCKRRGFVFQSSEIYGGLGSAWDYGPLGVELRRRIKDAWWRDVVQRRADMVGLDAAITMHPQVWKASGHVDSFADPFQGCAACGRYYRADQVRGLMQQSRWYQAARAALAKGDRAFANWLANDAKRLAPGLVARAQPDAVAREDFAGCPSCGGELSEPKPAGLMLETYLGPVRETATKVYLRPETAQGIFVNFENILKATRRKLPFGVAQIGKAFRNEITPGNFIFRTREFEQMEIEYFVMPGTDEKWHEHWIEERLAWYRRWGIRESRLRLREHGRDELAHYAKRCVDIEFEFPMGWSELEGIANRTDYDLRRHSEASGHPLAYFDEETKTHITPYVIEPSAGVDRTFLALLVDAYEEDEVRGEKRTVLRLHPGLAPVTVAVLPLLKNRADIVAQATELANALRAEWACMYDDTAAIGRLYRRQDEIGTPLCVTVDVQTVEEDRKVTIRERDTMEQVRIPLAEVRETVRLFLERGWPAVRERYGLWFREPHRT